MVAYGFYKHCVIALSATECIEHADIDMKKLLGHDTCCQSFQSAA